MPDLPAYLAALDMPTLRQLSEWLDLVAKPGSYAELLHGLVIIEASNRFFA